MLDEDELQAIAEEVADEGLETDGGVELESEEIAVVLAALQERGLDLSPLSPEPPLGDELGSGDLGG